MGYWIEGHEVERSTCFSKNLVIFCNTSQSFCRESTKVFVDIFMKCRTIRTMHKATINKLATDSWTNDKLLKELFKIVNKRINKKLILTIIDISPRPLDSGNAVVYLKDSNMASMLFGISSHTSSRTANRQVAQAYTLSTTTIDW